jgi:ATP-dependent DNA ligase
MCFTRCGRDCTNRFKIAFDALHLRDGSAIIDGEVVVAAEKALNELLTKGPTDRGG